MRYLSDELTSLAVEFAGSFRDWQIGWDDYSKVHDADEALMEKFNVFSQVRGTQGSIEEMEAVFYAGRDAWRDRCDPFLVVPLAEFD